jgi:hypothetical protein
MVWVNPGEDISQHPQIYDYIYSMCPLNGNGNKYTHLFDDVKKYLLQD